MRFRNAMRFFKNGVKELLQEGFDITKFSSFFKDDVANLVDGLLIIVGFLNDTDFSKINGYSVRSGRLFRRTTTYSGNA